MGHLHKILALLIATNLYAATIDEAKQLYAQKRYESSYEAFKSLFKTNMNNFEVNLFIARSANKIGKKNEAVASYERALMVDDSSSVARFELALLYYDMKLFDQSESEFKRVLSKPQPKEVRKTALQYMAAISNERKRHTLSFQASLGVLRDSNVKYQNDKDSEVETSWGTLTNKGEKEEDTVHYEQVVLHHIYNMDARNHYWQSRLTGFNQDYFDVEDAHIEYGSFETGWLYRTRDFTLNIPVGVGILRYDDEEVYKEYTIGFNADRPLDEYNVFATNIKVAQREREAKDQDSLVADLKLSLRHRNDSGSLFIYSWQYNYENYEKLGVRDIGQLTLGGRWYKSFKNRMSTDLSLALKDRRETEKVAIFVENRRDDIIDLSAGLNVPLNNRFYLSFNTAFTLNDSNIDAYDYKKYTYGMSINMQFDNR